MSASACTRCIPSCIFDYNSRVFGGFIHFLYQSETGMNILQMSCKICNFTLTLSPQYQEYLVKLETT